MVESAALESLLGEKIRSTALLTQGQIGPIYTLQTDSGRYLLKTSQPSSRLQTEAQMLEDINKYDIPVPRVHAVSQEYLLMDFIEESRGDRALEETKAAEVLAQLHSVTNESRMYGYWYDTTIGPFVQRNEQTQYNWTLFLGQMRIMPMAKLCYDKGQIDKKSVARLEGLCRDMYKRIDMAAITPSLLHGDLWSGNILFNIKGPVLIDPAVYFGDREVELAFILMFNTFGERFFARYTQVHPFSEDFHTVKVPLYQLYPYLVHVALYGDAYRGGLEQCLKALKV